MKDVEQYKVRETGASNSVVSTIPRLKEIRGGRCYQKLKVRWEFRQECLENSKFATRNIASMT